MIKHIENENQFNQEIAEGLAVVDFFATWCGPCRMLAPILEDVSEMRDDAKFLKVDVDENYDLAKSFGIMSVPTVLFFKNGNLVDKSIGLINSEKINQIIDKNK